MTTTIKALIRRAVASVLAAASVCSVEAETVHTDNVDIRLAGDFLNVNAEIVLDSLNLKSNRQIFITPVVRGDSSSVALPSLLVSGRNMHISYLRGALRGFDSMKSHEIAQEVRRINDTHQSISYSARIPVEPWMRGRDTNVVFVYDECGCGVSAGETISQDYILFENPVREMTAAMIIPEFEIIPVQIHEGRARLQFEVNRTELHVEPYTCRNSQRIDNRSQLRMIDDSVKFALSDPNVEISAIEICGYASPESPYIHNHELAEGRSKALAEYLADRYSLPRDKASYSSVAENWGEFREMVVESNEISDEQRLSLLDLIDAPAETPEQFDNKEKTLKTDPRFASLYKKVILPSWFPKLRATTFAIHTRLKDLSDSQLKEVIRTSPEKMSLNQMYRVARMYPEDSDEFNEVMLTALKFYPRDLIAITNAATAAIARGEYERARDLLSKAGENTTEIYNLLGIIATAEENYDAAARFFEKAGDDANAVRNLELLR